MNIERLTRFNIDEETIERKEAVKIALEKIISRTQVEGLALNRRSIASFIQERENKIIQM